MKKILSVLIVGAMVTGCSQEAKKKVLIMGRGEVNATGTEVVMKDGAGHDEKVLEVDKGVTELSVDAGSGKTSIKIPAEEGYYVLNLKKDTVVGSLQDVANASRGTISQESLQGMIDSMTQLTMGSNIKAGRNFIALPNQVVKVSSNEDARVFGPFNPIPSQMDPAKNDKPLEIYKLWTNSQLRERIATFKKATVDLTK